MSLLIKAGAAEIGGLYGLNVETLTGDKTLTPGTDKICQYLDPDGSNRVITLATSGAIAGDRFVIKHTGAYTDAEYLEIKQSTTTLDKAYAGAFKEYIFDGTNWVSVFLGTGDASYLRRNTVIGASAVAYGKGVAIGYSVDGHNCGIAIGYDAASGYNHGIAMGESYGYDYGVAIGGCGSGYNYGVAVGYDANGCDEGVAVGEYALGYEYGVAIGGCAEGYDCSVAIGYYSDTQAKKYAIALGYYSYCIRTAETSINIDGNNAQKNNAIQGRWSKATTDATPIEMFCGGIANQRFTVRAQSALAFKITVVARDNVADHAAMYTFEGVIKRDAANNTTMSVCNKLVIHEDDATWDCDVAADDTNEALIITVTGDATNPVQWAARMDGVETHF